MTRLPTRFLLVLPLVALAIERAPTRTIRTAHFVVTVADRVDPSEVTDALESGYRRVRDFGLRLPGSIAVTLHASSGDFARASGTDRTRLAAVRAGTMHLQPPSVLRRNGSLDRALAHELVHVALSGAAGRLPRWLEEGLAMNVAGEMMPVSGGYATVGELERALGAAHAAARRAYGTAERLVRGLSAALGTASVVAALDAVIEGEQADEAFRRHGGIDLSSWTASRLSAMEKARKRPRR
jgi:hypothetical protein